MRRVVFIFVVLSAIFLGFSRGDPDQVDAALGQNCDNSPFAVPSFLPASLLVEVEFPVSHRYLSFVARNTQVPSATRSGVIYNTIYTFQWDYNATKPVHITIEVTNPASGARYVSTFGIKVPADLKRSTKYVIEPVPRFSNGDNLFTTWSIITDRVPWLIWTTKPTFDLNADLNSKTVQTVDVMFETCALGEADNYDLLYSQPENSSNMWTPSGSAQESQAEAEEAAQQQQAALQTWGPIDWLKNKATAAWDGTKAAASSVATGVEKTFKGCALLKSFELPPQFRASIQLNTQRVGLAFNRGLTVHTRIGPANVDVVVNQVYWDFKEAKIKFEGQGLGAGIISLLIKAGIGKMVSDGLLPPAWRAKGYDMSKDKNFKHNLDVFLRNLGEKDSTDDRVMLTGFYDLFERGLKPKTQPVPPPRPTYNPGASSVGARLSNSFSRIFSTAEVAVELRVNFNFFKDRETCFDVQGLYPARAVRIRAGETGVFHVAFRTPKFIGGPVEALNSVRISKIGLKFSPSGLSVPGFIPGFRTPDMQILEYTVYPATGDDQFEQGNAKLVLAGGKQEEYPLSPISLGDLWSMLATLRNINYQTNSASVFVNSAEDRLHRADCGGFLGTLLDNLIRTNSRDDSASQIALAADQVAPGGRVFDDDCITPLSHLHAKINGYVYESPQEVDGVYIGCATPLLECDMKRNFRFARLTDEAIQTSDKFLANNKCGTRELYLGDYLKRIHRVVPVSRVFSQAQSGVDAQSFFFESFFDTGSATDKYFTFAIRGSDSSNDWCMNFQMTKLVPRTMSNVPFPGAVHQGMWTHWASIRDRVLPVFQRYVDKGYKIVITGHSLGAGAAILAAYDLIMTVYGDKPIPESLQVLLYGTPRVGSRLFVDAYDMYLGRFTRNHHNTFVGCISGMPVIGRDMVTTIPPNSFGFYDIGSTKNGKARICKMRCPSTCPSQTQCSQICPVSHQMTACHGTSNYADAFVAMYEYTNARGNMVKWRNALLGWKGESLKACAAPPSILAMTTQCAKP